MKPTGLWTADVVAGHPCDIFTPENCNEFGYAAIYLHGVHQTGLVDNPIFTEQFARLKLPVVVPYTKRSWWTDRICSEFDPHLTAERHLLDNVLAYVEGKFHTGRSRVALLGTGMGGQGALRIAYKYPDIFPVVAAIAPAIDYQIRFDEDDMISEMYSDPEAARQDTALLHIHPLNWPRHQFFCCDPTDYRWWDSAERLRMKLWSLGVPHECDLETTAGGHGFEYYNRMAPVACEFIAKSLDQERRRL